MITNITKSPIIIATKLLINKYKMRYSPTVICKVLWLNAGTDWILLHNGPNPYNILQYSKLLPYKRIVLQKTDKLIAIIFINAVFALPFGNVWIYFNIWVSFSCLNNDAKKNTQTIITISVKCELVAEYIPNCG